MSSRPRISFHFGFASVTQRFEENNPLFRVQRNFIPQTFGLSTPLLQNCSPFSSTGYYEFAISDCRLPKLKRLGDRFGIYSSSCLTF